MKWFNFEKCPLYEQWSLVEALYWTKLEKCEFRPAEPHLHVQAVHRFGCSFLGGKDKNYKKWYSKIQKESKIGVYHWKWLSNSKSAHDCSPAIPRKGIARYTHPWPQMILARVAGLNTFCPCSFLTSPFLSSFGYSSHAKSICYALQYVYHL